MEHFISTSAIDRVDIGESVINNIKCVYETKMRIIVDFLQ